jgi:hypothetical protein
MAKLCRISALAFMWGDIPMAPENGYGPIDLINGIDYCEGLMEIGFANDPIDKFSLSGYIEWAKGLLTNQALKDGDK